MPRHEGSTIPAVTVQTFPGMVLIHSKEPWAQAQLAQALALTRDHPQSAVWMQLLHIEVEDFRSQDGASTTQLASWPEWILEVLNFLIKVELHATDQDAGCGGVCHL